MSQSYRLKVHTAGKISRSNVISRSHEKTRGARSCVGGKLTRHSPVWGRTDDVESCRQSIPVDCRPMYLRHTFHARLESENRRLQRDSKKEWNWDGLLLQTVDLRYQHPVSFLLSLYCSLFSISLTLSLCLYCTFHLPLKYPSVTDSVFAGARS